MKIKRKRHFYFGKEKDTGYLYLKRSASNIFLTLTDLKHKVIICKTSGSSGIVASKRKKKNPHAIESIVRELNTFFQLYKITKIRLILRMRINTFFYFLNKELVFYGIKIVRFRLQRPIAFTVCEVVN